MRKWVRDAHRKAWVLYAVPPGGDAGLADIDGRVEAVVNFDLLDTAAAIPAVGEILAAAEAPPLPAGAWPAMESRARAVAEAIARLKEFRYIDLNPSFSDDGSYDRLARVALGLDLAREGESLAT